MKSKVIFEFEDRRIANLLAMILEDDDSNLIEILNSKILDFNEASENEDKVPIEQVSCFNIDMDDNNRNVEHIITCDYERRSNNT